MKKLAVTMCLLAVAAAAFGQGSVLPGNTGTSTFQTNALGIGGNGSGNAVSTGGPYYYAVLTAPSTVTSVDTSLQGLLSGPWSNTGIQATNTGIAGRENGANVVASNWGVNVTNSFVLVGWSANEGSTWAELATKLQGATLGGSAGAFVWNGGTLVAGGFVGATTIGFGSAGGSLGSLSFPAFPLFGSGPTPTGNPVSTTTTLWAVNAVPEPTTLALAGLGAAALVIFRRRK